MHQVVAGEKDDAVKNDAMLIVLREQESDLLQGLVEVQEGIGEIQGGIIIVLKGDVGRVSYNAQAIDDEGSG
jgi:hypothetical protein